MSTLQTLRKHLDFSIDATLFFLYFYVVIFTNEGEDSGFAHCTDCLLHFEAIRSGWRVVLRKQKDEESEDSHPRLALISETKT